LIVTLRNIPEERRSQFKPYLSPGKNINHNGLSEAGYAVLTVTGDRQNPKFIWSKHKNIYRETRIG
jgi:hypothetical protein